MPNDVIARPHGAASARARRLVPLQRDRRRPADGPRGQRARPRARQRPDRDHRSDRDAHARRHQHGRLRRPAHRAVERSAVEQLLLAEPGESGRAPAGGPHRLQPQRQPSPDRHVQQSLRGPRSGSSQRRRSALPGLAELPARSARRPPRSVALRSTLSNTLVNELRGRHHARRAVASSARPTAAAAPQTFDDTNGFAIDLDGDLGLTNWHMTNTLSSRSGYQYTFDETLNWQKGKHSVTFGGGAFLGRAWDDSQQLVPGINLRLRHDQRSRRGHLHPGELPGRVGRPARPTRAISTRCSPAASAPSPARPRSIPRRTRYSFLGKRRRAGKLDIYSAFVQDSWRLTPTLTLNAGLRWDVQMPFAPSNDTMTTASLADVCGVSGLGDGGLYNACNFYAPGASGGKVAGVRAVHDRERAATTPTGTTSRRTSASPGGRTSRAAGCARCSAIRSRRRFAAATRSPTSARASAGSPASTAPTRAAR